MQNYHLSSLNEIVKKVSRKFNMNEKYFEIDESCSCIHCNNNVDIVEIYLSDINGPSFYVYLRNISTKDIKLFQYDNKKWLHTDKILTCINSSQSVRILMFPSNIEIKFIRHPKTTIENAIESVIKECQGYLYDEDKVFMVDHNNVDKGSYIPLDSRTHKVIITKRMRGN